VSGVNAISLSSVVSKAAMAGFDYKLAVAYANRCFVQNGWRKRDVAASRQRVSHDQGPA
jgi:hypothetical protein